MDVLIKWIIKYIFLTEVLSAVSFYPRLTVVSSEFFCVQLGFNLLVVLFLGGEGVFCFAFSPFSDLPGFSSLLFWGALDTVLLWVSSQFTFNQKQISKQKL